MWNKRRVILVLGLILGYLSLSYGAPCYGLKLPKKNKFFLGMQYHQILERKLEKDLGELESKQGFLLLSYGIFEWLSLDLKAGAGNITKKSQDSVTAKYPFSFAGGYGFRLKLLDKENKKVIFGFQHISVHPKSIHINSNKHSAILDDWQVSLLGGVEFKGLSPYLGLRGSRVDYIHKKNKERKRIMSDSTKSIGCIFGLDIPLREKLWLNLEADLLDSKEFSFSLNFSF